MALDWDALVLAPVMAVFGEGDPANADTLPLYTPRRASAFRLRDAVFDSEYEQVIVNSDESQSTTHRPVLGVRLALFEEPPAQNDTVYIPSTDKTYVVKDVQQDGHGHAKLMLMATAR